MQEQHDKAIKAALKGEWELAVETNLEILATNPTNIQALNRLARAYTELGQKDAAKQTYESVIKIDKYDSIATKNLRLLPHQKNNMSEISVLSSEDFIELPGITKSINLIKVASRDILLGLVCKEILTLVPRTRLIAVQNSKGLCIGSLPDDISLRLKSLLKLGYIYSVCLKSASDNAVSVFIRETKRPKKATLPASFSRATLSSKSKKAL